MPIWNANAIDYSQGVHNENGLAKANKIGTFVLTLEEAKEIYENVRNKNKWSNIKRHNE